MVISGKGFKNFKEIDLQQVDGAAYLDIAGAGVATLKLGDGST